jgi:hypothetical protein
MGAVTAMALTSDAAFLYFLDAGAVRGANTATRAHHH